MLWTAPPQGRFLHELGERAKPVFHFIVAHGTRTERRYLCLRRIRQCSSFRYCPDRKLPRSWGEAGSNPGQFNIPHMADRETHDPRCAAQKVCGGSGINRSPHNCVTLYQVNRFGSELVAHTNARVEGVRLVAGR
jgi:hypothetical protein